MKGELVKRRGERLNTRYEAKEGVCRICQETTEVELLTKPCKCTGSIIYVHEVCLKTWILSKHIELEKAKCELCASSYSMTFKIATVCNIKDSLRSKNPKCLVFLFIVSGMMLLSFMLIGTKKVLDRASSEQRSFYCSWLASAVLCSHYSQQ